MSELQIDMESGDGLERRLRVQVPAARIEDEVELRLRNVARTAKIKGFRPGKVPVTVIRQHYGDEVRREVLQEVLQSSYSEAVSQQNLRPAGGPRIEPDSLEAGHDLTYTAVFEVYPEVQLQGLDDIQVTRPVVSITDADIDAMIEKLRAQRADWNPVERPAREGDRVRVDFTAVLNNEPLPGGSGEDVSIVLGEQQMLPEFEASLTGLSAGDEKTFDLTFPDDYHEQSLAGQTATFTVQLREVAERVLPEIDDSFLRAYGITSGELEDLRADIRVHMQREVETRQRSELRQQVMEGLLAANELDVPGVLVDEEAEALQQEAMRQAGITDAAKAPPVDTFRDAARQRVRMGILASAVVSEFGLEADQDAVKAKVDELCSAYDNPEEIARMYLQNPQLLARVESAVLDDRVVDLLLAKAKVSEREYGFDELMQQ